MENKETISSFHAVELVTKLLAVLLVESRKEDEDIRDIALEMSLILHGEMAEIIKEKEGREVGMPF